MPLSPALKSLTILLVEDSPSDILLITEAFKRAMVRHALHVVRDGVEALAFLHHEETYGNAPRPDLILLDWHLPRKDGRETFAEIKTDAHLRVIPVVALSTSQDERDIRAAYNLHVNGYITKPENFQQLVEIVQSLEQFWGTIVTLL